jgi:hypothetical protein
MEERSLWQDLRTVLKNIAGQWYAAEKDETMVFSVCETSSQEAAVTITDKNKNKSDTVYSVGAYLPESLEAIFYIDMGKDWHSKRWYKINEISPTNMRIIEISKSAERKEIGNEIFCTKKNA